MGYRQWRGLFDRAIAQRSSLGMEKEKEMNALRGNFVRERDMTQKRNVCLKQLTRNDYESDCCVTMSPISTCLSNVLNKDAKTVASVSVRLCESQRTCQINLFTFTPRGILHTLVEMPNIAYSLRHMRDIDSALFCTSDRRNPLCTPLADQLPLLFVQDSNDLNL